MNYFDDPGSKHFSFESFAMGLDINTFGVINFKGYEAISKPYDFEIMLVSSKKDIDFEDMLQAQAVFTIHRGSGDDVLYNGILSEFDQLHEVNDVIFYRARLVPKLWWLTLTHHNQVFLNQSAPDFIDDALRDGGLETADIDIGSLNGYDDISYTCQYDESHFNFVSRWMERQGIYYYFDQQADGEVMVLTDTKFSHYALKQGSDLFYNPASGLEGTHMAEAIGAFTCRQKQLPSEIILKDYNYEKPSLDITSRANVDLRGRGVSYIYGEFFATPEEGENLAQIRAEELLCQKQEFFGESTVPNIMPGFTFNMHNHYRDDFNQEYLVLEVTHEGNQSHLMSGGIAADAGKGQNQAIYRNSFKAIPNETQYRPERLTEKPKISGTIHAMIDSEVDGEYAQIDEQGRYRVKLPFDINDEHLDGKGSAPVRMMQSYAGKNRGMQFPLVKGTEVLLTFIEGNPDRPVIAGAVSNPETQGPVNHDNQSESVISTGGNNRIRMEDKSGSERIMFESPSSNSWIRVGATNDPIVFKGESPTSVKQGETYVDEGATAMRPGLTISDPAVAEDISFSSITDPSNNTSPDPNDPNSPNYTEVDTNVIGIWQVHFSDTGTLGTHPAIRKVFVHDPNDTDITIEQRGTESDGIRFQSAGNLWLEARSRYGEYHTGLPSDMTADATREKPQIGDLLTKFGNDYNPTNLQNYHTKEVTPIKALLAEGHVRVSSLDTFNTQEGNIYDFGGYWEYNLGNSYEESHISQLAKLNVKHELKSGKAAEYPTATVVGTAIMGVVVTAVTVGIAGAGAGRNAAIGAGIAGGVWATILPMMISGLTYATDSKGGERDLSDVIKGPNSGKIFSSGGFKQVGSSFKHAVNNDSDPLLSGKIEQAKIDAFKADPNQPNPYTQDFKQEGDSGWAPMHTDTTWVTKTFGDTYEFSKGNTLSISKGHTEEHSKGDSYEYSYGGRSEETKFNGAGVMTYHSWSESGQSQEQTYHPMDGALINWSYKDRKSIFVDIDITLPSSPSFSASVNMAPLSTEANFKIGVSASLDIDFGVSTSISLGVGFATEIEAVAGFKLKMNPDDGIELSGPGTKANKDAEFKASVLGLVVQDAKSEIDSKKLHAKVTNADITDAKLSFNNGQFIYA